MVYFNNIQFLLVKLSRQRVGNVFLMMTCFRKFHKSLLAINISCIWIMCFISWKIWDSSSRRYAFPWECEMFDFNFLASAYTDGCPVLSLAIFSFHRQCSVDEFISISTHLKSLIEQKSSAPYVLEWPWTPSFWVASRHANSYNRLGCILQVIYYGICKKH